MPRKDEKISRKTSRKRKDGKQRKLPPGLQVQSKKICRGRLTVDNAQGGMYLKGLRSQFTERYALNDENSARRDEDLCRLIDCGLPQLRKKPDPMFDEHESAGNVNQHLFGLARNPRCGPFRGENSAREEPVANGEEIDRAWQSASGSFLLRSPEVASSGFRLPQHHFQHSERRNENVSSNLEHLFPSHAHTQLPSIQVPAVDSFFRSQNLDSWQKFVPSDHSTPIAVRGVSAVAPVERRLSVEDEYLNFQEQLDRACHDLTNIIGSDDLDDRQQLCQYYMRRLRSMDENTSHQQNHPL